MQLLGNANQVTMRAKAVDVENSPYRILWRCKISVMLDRTFVNDSRINPVHISFSVSGTVFVSSRYSLRAVEEQVFPVGGYVRESLISLGIDGVPHVENISPRTI